MVMFTIIYLNNLLSKYLQPRPQDALAPKAAAYVLRIAFLKDFFLQFNDTKP